ncbi:tRNA adenine-34 [Nymphaea thermarum]|nr:tRNA adenine-34 [Nymphaea thermarum]
MDKVFFSELDGNRFYVKGVEMWMEGTTLYVTLEPCAMCAGAILQARIDTLVWGAPNKLLGADGSWVRLFHSPDEGQSSSGQPSSPAGPVHPFHPNMKIRREFEGSNHKFTHLLKQPGSKGNGDEFQPFWVSPAGMSLHRTISRQKLKVKKKTIYQIA